MASPRLSNLLLNGFRITLIMMVVCEILHAFEGASSEKQVSEAFIKDANASINASVIRSITVSNPMDCAWWCMSDFRCFSFNMAKDHKDGMLACDFFAVDKHTFDSRVALAGNNSGHHFSPKHPCLGVLCPLNLRKCVPIYKGGQLYTCETGYDVTCRHIKTAFPSSLSGSYMIDPDGEGGAPPFNVYCDMTGRDGIGVTVISHDTESRTSVVGYEDTGEYSRDITYTGASVTQLTALTLASNQCEQFIKLECRQVLLHYSYWVSRDGVTMTSWGGAPMGSSRSCACGVTNTCIESKKCNCLTQADEYHVDEGLLVGKERLPVKQLRIGDTGDNGERLYYTLGKFECY